MHGYAMTATEYARSMEQTPAVFSWRELEKQAFVSHSAVEALLDTAAQELDKKKIPPFMTRLFCVGVLLFIGSNPNVLPDFTIIYPSGGDAIVSTSRGRRRRHPSHHITSTEHCFGGARRPNANTSFGASALRN